VVGIILIPRHFTGNASFKNEIASSLPTWCKFKLSVIVIVIVIVHIERRCLYRMTDVAACCHWFL
jgi:hypothetical protein